MWGWTKESPGHRSIEDQQDDACCGIVGLEDCGCSIWSMEEEVACRMSLDTRQWTVVDDLIGREEHVPPYTQYVVTGRPCDQVNQGKKGRPNGGDRGVGEVVHAHTDG